MPAYRTLDARFTGCVADATRRADALYHSGDLAGAMSTLEGALAQSITTPPHFPSWAVMRLAFVYRRLRRYQDEAELLERSLPYQPDESSRRRILLRLEKASSMVARITPRRPMVLVPPSAARPGESGVRGECDVRTDSRLRLSVASGPDSLALHNATHQVGMAFLRAEVEIANTMLDLAEHSTDDASRARRYARASEAAAEIMAHLTADGSPIRWTDAEHEELSGGLWTLARRIRAAVAARRTLDDMFIALWPPSDPRRHTKRDGSADSPRS